MGSLQFTIERRGLTGVLIGGRGGCIHMFTFCVTNVLKTIGFRKKFIGFNVNI